MIDRVIELWPSQSAGQIARKLGRGLTRRQVMSKVYNLRAKGVELPRKRKYTPPIRWVPSQIYKLIELWPDNSVTVIAMKLGMKRTAVASKVLTLRAKGIYLSPKPRNPWTSPLRRRAAQKRMTANEVKALSPRSNAETDNDPRAD